MKNWWVVSLIVVIICTPANSFDALWSIGNNDNPPISSPIMILGQITEQEVGENVSIKLNTEPELTRGEEFLIAAIISDNSSISETGEIGIPDIEVFITLTAALKNGNSENFTKFAVSNNVGVALVGLTKSETKTINVVERIAAVIRLDETNVITELEEDLLPRVVEPDQNFFEKVFDFLKRNTLLLTFMTIFFATSTVVLLIKCNKIPLKESMWPKEEK